MHQVSLFALPQDMGSLLSSAERAGAKAYPPVVPAGVTPAPLPLSRCAGRQDGASFVLLPARLATAEIFYTPLVDDPTRAQVDQANSPVVVVDACLLDGALLFNGRLFLDDEPSDPRHAAAKRLFATLRRVVGKWERTTKFGIYVGPETAARARSGKLTLRHHTLSLELA